MGGCTLCPRMCGADREHGELGFCGMPAEIYAARETNTVGISSKDLADQIVSKGGISFGELTKDDILKMIEESRP